MDTSVIHRKARLLTESVLHGVEEEALSTVTVAIYDTAWVSMVFRRNEEGVHYVFPESFAYLLHSQLPNGGWEAYASRDDGILNTLAALLAMKKHQRSINPGYMLQARIKNAIEFLQSSLQEWDVGRSVHVGFEVLVPALFSLLEKEGIEFVFPGRASLNVLNEVKLKSFNAQMLYGKEETTLIHSLEAFIGKIDFDQVRHHKTFGSMMASPASTAAYLMNVSTWDKEAETYLRKVICKGTGKGSGAVPSVFPTPIFEASWVLSTLLQSGYTASCLGKVSLESIALYLEKHYHAQDGLLGFAPSIQADADDSAKAMLCLNLIGRAVDPKTVPQHFKSKDGYFCTYLGERDASISANCNFLKALLEVPSVQNYVADIKDLLEFLCDSWWGGAIKDKWNISPQYSMMLLAESLVRFLELWDKDHIHMSPGALLRDRIPVTLVQILNRTLITQNLDGSWGLKPSLEITAYAVMTLKVIVSLPWLEAIAEGTSSAIVIGQDFLREGIDGWSKPQHLWIEKVTYGSQYLSEAYCLAAVFDQRAFNTWTDRTSDLLAVSKKAATKVSQLLASLRVCRTVPRWKILAYVLEGMSFLPGLLSTGARILQGQQEAQNEYLTFIPCTWIIVNNLRHLELNTNFLWDMMVLTIGNFHVDEYMETKMAKMSEETLGQARSVIHALCGDLRSETSLVLDSSTSTQSATTAVSDCLYSNKRKLNCTKILTDLASVEAVLGPYIQGILHHPRIQHAPHLDHRTLRTELCAFLLSHMDQISDNKRFSHQPNWSPQKLTQFLAPRTSFFTWLHTTGADSVSCPFSFAFLICLIGSSDGNANSCFESTTQKHQAKDLCKRLSVMSRLYNDYGSVSRDTAEGNLNSVNFPEFYSPQRQVLSGCEPLPRSEMTLKMEVFELAKYERESANTVLLKLNNELRGNNRRGERVADALTLFSSVSEVYADIYVVRDLSNKLADT